MRHLYICIGQLGSNYFYRLISATPVTDDPVNLLVNAGQTFVPVNAALPSSSTIKSAPNVTSLGYERPPINQIISNISSSIWYKDQIVHQLSVEPKVARTCLLPLNYRYPHF